MSICEADRGYDSDKLRQEMLARGYVSVIGYRNNQKERVETKEIYEFFKVRRRRWVVERAFAWLKRKCRRLMMRWERKPVVLDAVALLCVIFMRIQRLLG